MRFPVRRASAWCVLLLSLVAVTFPTSAAAAAREPAGGVTRLAAPFRCGTEWRGSTYPGHGSNNWNLDVNRPDGSGDDDWGEPILAQGEGTVVWFKENGYNNRAGTYVEIDYGEVTARYVHLVANSIPSAVAEVGARVTAGQVIGLLGDTGRATRAHLHLEYWNSADQSDAAWYELPRGNHMPVVIEGDSKVATPGTPTEPFLSGNCGGPSYRFDDVAVDSPARLDAALVSELDVLPASGPRRFSPSRYVTREELATATARLWRRLDGDAAELPPVITVPFVDVEPAADDVALARHLGFVSEVSAGRFRPESMATRADVDIAMERLRSVLASPAQEHGSESVRPGDPRLDPRTRIRRDELAMSLGEIYRVATGRTAVHRPVDPPMCVRPTVPAGCHPV